MLFLSIGVLLTAVSAAVAQSHVPPVLVIAREDIKPGEMSAHDKEAISYIQTLSKANARLSANLRNGRIAAIPIAGNQNEVTYFSAYESFRDLETKRKEMDKLATGIMKADFDRLPDAKLHSSQREIIATLRSDVSYNLDRANVPESRYFAVTILRLKLGHEDTFWEMIRKTLNPARAKAGLSASNIVYQVRAGAPMGTYYIFRPMKSLAELDQFASTVVRESMSKDDREALDKASDKAIQFVDLSYYQINPRLSLVSPEFAAMDKSGTPFWNPRLQVETRAPARRASARRNPQQ